MSPSITCRRFVAINSYISGEEAVITAKLPIRLFDKKVPPFARKISGVFADVEPPGNESWKLQCTKSITISCRGHLLLPYTP